ncbi:Zinc finger CCCH domain-containing protein 42, partial [Tetrabaena socialis]
MNPLTQIKNTQKATRREIEAGISDSASWHARFKHSAYIFAGGLDYDLTEGDLLAVFAQYGEVVDMNLIRNKDTGKSMGFAFVAYEDQRSTVVAVDNLNGAKVAGRTIRVEHVDNYKKRKAELEGEDPNAVDDGEEENGARGEESVGAAAAAGERRLGGPPARGRSPPPAARSAAPSSEPWAGSGSIFALLEEARQLESAKQ